MLSNEGKDKKPSLGGLSVTKTANFAFQWTELPKILRLADLRQIWGISHFLTKKATNHYCEAENIVVFFHQ